MSETKYVFFGTPEFAAIVLEKLIEGDFIPAAVVCNPDRPAGRHRVITPPKVKKYILEKGLPVEILQPENPNSIIGKLSAIHPEFFIVAAYGKILPKEIIEIPRLGTIGVHSSLLPKYRGTSPIHEAIIAGEKETGVTLFMMDEKMDHGPIIAQCKIPITPNDTHETLFPKIWGAGGKTLGEILPDFLAGKIKPHVQDEASATYTKKFTSANGFIEPQDLDAALGGDSQKAIFIDRKIRAFGVEPGVWTYAKAFANRHMRIDGVYTRALQHSNSLQNVRMLPYDKRVKILDAELTPDGKLKLKTIQIEGQKSKVV
ncbi:MAG: methionyl-tRNA formyltransferase [Candidatus Liptonbacteria bacterium]|nr:methionyl-tRNA formyltransferase [Candidatus Liptonbacteria bacterium]